MKLLIFSVTALSIALSAPVFSKKPEGDEWRGKSAQAKAKHKKGKKGNSEQHRSKKHRSKNHKKREKREYKSFDGDDSVTERKDSKTERYSSKRVQETPKTQLQSISNEAEVSQPKEAIINPQVNQSVPVSQNPVDIVIDTNVNSLKGKIDKYHGQAVDAIDKESNKLKDATETSTPWWDLFGG